VDVGTYADTATGSLEVTLCAHQVCAAGAADIARVRDGQPLAITLDKALEIAAGETFTMTFRRGDGANLIAVWLFNPASGDQDAPQEQWLLRLGFMTRPALLPVHQGPAMAIFEIPEVRSYFSASGCDVTPLSRNRADVLCKAPSTLVRLELYMRGWSARINGRSAVLGQEDDTFQTVDLPAGKSIVSFSYWPPGFTPALVAALAGMAFVLAVFASAVRPAATMLLQSARRRSTAKS
jgi:hypothetical protein